MKLQLPKVEDIWKSWNFIDKIIYKDKYNWKCFYSLPKGLSKEPHISNMVNSNFYYMTNNNIIEKIK